MEQPTIEELHAAWTAAIECEGIPGARSETIQKLREMRNAKSTWVGVKENEIRKAINSYLDERF